jgi:hypothetical protein
VAGLLGRGGVTAQEIYEREGFIVWTMDRWTCEIGEVVEEHFSDAVVPLGTKLVITEQITKQQAKEWARRNGLPSESSAIYFYKAIAE